MPVYVHDMDDDDLEAFAREHLRYEVWMLGETARWLIAVHPEASLVARNAYLESFGIHARALGDFLSNKGTHADDVLAKHYSGGWPGEDPAPGMARTVNKRVAHLTRVRLDKEPINPWEVHERLVDSFRRFVGTLPEPRHRWFDWLR